MYRNGILCCISKKIFLYTSGKILFIMAHEFIESLRKLDENIDFARGVLQWQIVLFLAEHGPSSTSEIAKGIGVNKKAVTDSIRKLIAKGLVAKVKYDIYSLSSTGQSLVEELKVISQKDLQQKVETKAEEEINILNNVTHYYYFVEIIKAAMLYGGKVPITSLSRELGISKKTLLNYLEIFSTKYKYFKKINKKKLFGLKVEYVITDEGKKVGYKIPGIYKVKNNVFLKILTRVTGSTSLESSIFKLMLAFASTAPLVFMLSETGIYRIVAVVWLYLLIMFSLSGAFAYILSRM